MHGAVEGIAFFVVLFVAATAQECKDSAEYQKNCAWYSDYDLCKITPANKYLGFMADHCSKTCAYCKEDANCDDSVRYRDNCARWKENAFCKISATNTYLSFMQQHCRKTCSFCVVPCKNSGRYSDENCVGWNSYCIQNAKNRYYGFMMDHCKATCGKCGDDKPVVKPKVECGLRPSSRGRVIGGMNATANSWPWQVALLYGGGYHCGGTLIDSEWVLTASHCTTGRTLAFFSVTLGEHDREILDGPEQNIKAGTVFDHPSYNPDTYENDIALIKLEKPATLNRYVSPACLPDMDEVVPSQKLCFLTGWGKMVHPGPFGRFLQQVDLPIVSQTVCKRDNNPFGISLDVTDAMICGGEGAGGGVKSGCHGDSGGPFVCASKDRWFVQGAVSWGSSSCNAKLKHTVFARVSKYVDWINKTMKDN